MVATPTVTPVTIPVEAPTLAMLGLLLLHTPPPASVNTVVPAIHTWLGPVIGDGDDITVMVRVAAQPVGNV